MKSIPRERVQPLPTPPQISDGGSAPNDSDLIFPATTQPAFAFKIFMKTLTCRQLGGACDEKLTAETWDDMVKTISKHVMEKHPDVAKDMEKMHNEDPRKWGREMKPKWDAAKAA
ncbi:MAG TPA: hypothetical protein VE218_07715 [Acidobacteriaceae bacterium]|nr:hypothetical protein [Acidobacteriaceae bacterium]